MREVLKYTLDYLKEQVKDFQSEQRGRLIFFTCPICHKHFKCTLTPHTFISHCHSCNKTYGNLFDWVRYFEDQFEECDNNRIEVYLRKKFKIPLEISKKQIHEILQYYYDWGFDLVPVQSNGKIPIEMDWPNKSHREISEWKRWLATGLNFGVKTGKISNITVIDIDTHEIDKNVLDNVLSNATFKQITNKGFHFFFQYEPSLPKTRIDQFKLDIENDLGQVVIYPSEIDGVKRQFFFSGEIPKLSEKALRFLKNYIRSVPKNLKVEADLQSEKIDLNLDNIEEGNRTNFLIRFGGILRKELNAPQTRYVMDLINRRFVKPSLPQKEFLNITNSLDKYIRFDHKDIAQKILNYLREVDDASSRDVREVVNEKKELVDKALAFLLKEGYVLKNKRLYKIVKKADWVDIISDEIGNEINFKMPYFNDIAVFRPGDMILLGAKSKRGKTHVAVNILKQLSEQNIKPYYIYLEPGGRFKNIALKLNLKDGDIWHDFQSDPTSIELEKNAVTILDWLLIEDKAATDSILKHFSKQLHKTKGILFIFMQLKKDNTFFAPNLIEFFPSLVTRYIYENEEEGTYGYWNIDVIREPKTRLKTFKIPCRYDFDTKELIPVIETVENKNINEGDLI